MPHVSLFNFTIEGNFYEFKYRITFVIHLCSGLCR